MGAQARRRSCRRLPRGAAAFARFADLVLVEAVGQYDKALLDTLEREFAGNAESFFAEAAHDSSLHSAVGVSLLRVVFLIYAALSTAAWLVAPSAIRLGESLKPRFAARLLLVLRLLPVAVAAFIVSALCVPSYLWLEPDADAERVGIACCLVALLGVALWATSLARVLRAIFISLRYRRRCERESNATLIPNQQEPLLVVDIEGAVLALAGVIRPRVVVSRGVLQALLPHQLDAALEHERAHQFSRDNLKRFLCFSRRAFTRFREASPPWIVRGRVSPNGLPTTAPQRETRSVRFHWPRRSYASRGWDRLHERLCSSVA